MGGVQLGSRWDNGHWAYSAEDMGQRLGGTFADSLLTFGLTNLPAAAHNINRSYSALAAAGEARLLAGEMPSQDQLRAMGMSESEARGLLAVLGMEAPDSLDEPTDDSLSTDRTYSSKRALFEHNKQQGKIYEQEQFALFCQNYSHAEEQITIRPLFGKKTRVDAIGLDADGNIVIHEFKSSRTAPLTRNQNDAFPQIEKYGGVVVGKGKGIFVRGYPIPPGTKIKIIRAELPN